jgi:hypothetical protein
MVANQTLPVSQLSDARVDVMMLCFQRLGGLQILCGRSTLRIAIINGRNSHFATLHRAHDPLSNPVIQTRLMNTALFNVPRYDLSSALPWPKADSSAASFIE